jgi:purine-binding chemotaxis protein CheW
MKGLSFLVGGELYAVDVTLVQKVARMLAITPVPSAPLEIVGIANLKGKVVTVLSLSKLIGDDKPCEATLYSNTIVFKYSLSNEDQMGLAVEKPGNLIDIDDSAIRSPPVSAGSEENCCISGVTEVDDDLYRIIDIEAILRRYIPDSD